MPPSAFEWFTNYTFIKNFNYNISPWKNSNNVYYPIFENTIEMIIYNILQKKKGIIDQVMGDGEFSESFGKDLLKELL